MPRELLEAESLDRRLPSRAEASSADTSPSVEQSSRDAQVLQLQALYGNDYVQQLLAGQGAGSPTSSQPPAPDAGPPPPDAEAEVAQQPTQVQAPTSNDVSDQPTEQVLEQTGRGALESLAGVATQVAATAPPASGPLLQGAPDLAAPAPDAAAPIDLGVAAAVPAPDSSVVQQSAAQLDAVRGSAAQLASAPDPLVPVQSGDPGSDADQAQQAAASSALLSDFTTGVANRAQQITDLATPVPETVQAAAAAATQTITAQVEQQVQAVTAHVESLRSQAGAEAQAARDSVMQEFTSTCAALTQVTATARQQLETEYTAALQSIDSRENAQLQVIDARYTAGDQRFRDAGRIVGDEAAQRGKQMADQYMAGLVDEDDSWLDGPLTYKRGKARADTATQMGEGYQKGLQDEANKQADQAQQGKAHDVETARTTARQAREALAAQHSAVLGTLADAEATALQQAEQARSGLYQGIDQALQGAMQALAQQESALQQGVRESGQAQSNAIAQQAELLIGSIHDQLAQAATGVLDSGSSLLAQLQGQTAPAADVLAPAIAEANAQLDAGVADVQDRLAEGIATGQQQISQAADTIGADLCASTQTGLDAATQAASEITSALTSLGGSAAETFGNIQQSHTAVLANTSTSAQAGFRQAVDGVQQAYDQMSAGLERGFAENAAGLEQGLRGALPKMEEEIRVKAEENASHVPPRWKSVLKWVLIIAVVVVVALVVGPFVIGAVGAALGTGAVMTGIIAGAIVGAATSATIQVINNWAENKPLGEGVLKAAVIGAIGGAVGGGFGAWVGQLGQQGAAIANTAFRQFALNTVANIVTENAINIATGNFSWASFGMSIVSAVAVGGAMHAASGFKPIASVQEASMAAGEGVGGSMLRGVGGTVEINYRPTETPTRPADVDAAAGESVAVQGGAKDLPAASGEYRDTRGWSGEPTATPAAGQEHLKVIHEGAELLDKVHPGAGSRLDEILPRIENPLPDHQTRLGQLGGELETIYGGENGRLLSTPNEVIERSPDFGATAEARQQALATKAQLQERAAAIQTEQTRLQEEITTARAQLEQDALAQMDTLRERLLSRGRAAAEGMEPSFEPSAKAALEAKSRSVAAAESDASEFYKLTRGRGPDPESVSFESNGGRPEATPGRVDIGDEASRRTLFHEMGHHLEFNDPKLLEASRAFVDARAANAGRPNDLVRLDELAPSAGYKPGEVAKVGGFVDPYTGKVYPSSTGATEVVSTGMEAFRTPQAMLDLYRQDPEHFLYMMGVLR